MEATVRTTWSIDWTAKGGEDIVSVAEFVVVYRISWSINGWLLAFVTRSSMDVVGLKDLGCVRSRPHFVLDRHRN
jgi:hypothetical protein